MVFSGRKLKVGLSPSHLKCKYFAGAIRLMSFLLVWVFFLIFVYDFLKGRGWGVGEKQPVRVGAASRAQPRGLRRGR